MKYLHTMVRVTDIEASLRFYRDALGLKELSRMDNQQGRFTLVFLAAPGDESAQVELTYNWDQKKPYEIGSGFGHLAVGVPDVKEVCEHVTNAGGKVTRAPGPVKFGTTVIAFVTDPDGYKIELIQRGSEAG